MKRNKHVLINLTENQFNIIESIAKKNKRKLSEYCYLILIEQLTSEAIKYNIDPTLLDD